MLALIAAKGNVFAVQLESQDSRTATLIHRKLLSECDEGYLGVAQVEKHLFPISVPINSRQLDESMESQQVCFGMDSTKTERCNFQLDWFKNLVTCSLASNRLRDASRFLTMTTARISYRDMRNRQWGLRGIV